MRKIFFAIIALAALVGCNTDMMEEVATAPQYLTTSLEVALDDQTRAYDENLKWSWEPTDQIAAYQVYGDQIVNTLSLKENGKFGTDEFTYATNESVDFKFVYPATALNADKTLGYVQTGVWTPTLVGTVEATTVDNIGNESIAMEHHSAAFEIRVWDENKTDRKTIKGATITSESDFCNGTTATVEGLVDTNTVVFNIAAGDFAFNLTLTATDGTTYTVAVPQKNFVLGKRTILNVQWKYPPTASYTVYSSYNSNDGSVSKNNGVDGRSIYVKNVAIQHIVSDAATLTLKRTYNGSALDDVALTVGQEWSANNLALGTYTFQLVLTDGDYTWSTAVSSIYVTGLPYTLNPATNDSWNAWTDTTGSSNIDWNVDGTLRLGYNVESVSTWGCSTEAAIQKSFYLPENTTVTVMCTGQAIGSDMWGSKNSTIFSLTVSGATVGSTESGKASTKSFNYNKSIIMTSANPTVVCSNSNSVSRGRSQVSSLTIKY